jgi:hypothetical protein
MMPGLAQWLQDDVVVDQHEDIALRFAGRAIVGCTEAHVGGAEKRAHAGVFDLSQPAGRRIDACVIDQQDFAIVPRIDRGQQAAQHLLRAGEIVVQSGDDAGAHRGAQVPVDSSRRRR